MATILDIDLTNSPGNSYDFFSNKKMSAGTVETEDMKKSQHKTTVEMVDINAYDYGIIDVGIVQFDDTLPYSKKVETAQLRIEYYKTELKDAESWVNALQTEINKVNSELTEYQDQYEEAKKQDPHSALTTNLKQIVKNYKEQLNDLNTEFSKYKKITQTHPKLIKAYTNFYNDLTKYGEKKAITRVDEFGNVEEAEQVDLDNLDINHAPGMEISGAITDAVTQYLEVTIQSLIAGGASNLMNNLGINQETLGMAQSILNLMDSTLFNITGIIKMFPKNIQMLPSAKIAIGSICTSLKDMYIAIYNDLENEYYETINDAITNLPSIQEVLKDAQELLMNTIWVMINEQCIKYTGYTLPELYYMCSDYIHKYKAWKEARKEQKRRKKEQEEQEKETGIQHSSGGTVSSKINVDVDPDIIKQSLMDELSRASDLIYNSFIIIQIKDSIDEIKMLISQFNNVDLDVLTDGIDSFEDFMNMLVEMGLDSDGAVISLEKAIQDGINQFSGNLTSLQNQIEAQAISSGLHIAADVVSNTTVSTEIKAEHLYDFTNDLNTFTMTLNIYADPTTKKAKKQLTKVLSNAHQKDGTKIFDSSSVLSIINAIDEGYVMRKDQTIELLEFTFKIHFELDGFNKKLNEQINAIDEANRIAQEIAKKKEAEEAISKFELGIVEEEYTGDPTKATKRPTFQLVHELFSILKEIFPQLKVILKLIRNYKINKAKVEANASGNLLGMIKVIAAINKLFKKAHKSKTNFYTVRSLKLYDYITNSITSIGTNVEINIGIPDTRKLYLYLKNAKSNYEIIKQDLPTILYIDQDAITEQRNAMKKDLDKAGNYFDDASLFVQYPDSKYQDGTLLGLDKVEDADTEIYYSDSSLPLYGSQILRCYGKDYDLYT
ncbi:MAG: hypothetical protein [phage Lak_Megaphage_RVC_AP4_GC26]|uniref:Uncharacterized protein n=1 Tax=phage Lak_Megaphage_RVC_AP3_GC26 TaxID=3109225 RepID=A0ABZ0Z2C4_9CAUD|nr:MAG: hypothetical protein [phage Lak_Megaphage_RVC_AP3_GC26]WQJ52377.1 MAG: hypothetical protein [phage Lak_Megaphage_RVC_AP4_GC26]